MTTKITYLFDDSDPLDEDILLISYTTWHKETLKKKNDKNEYF